MGAMQVYKFRIDRAPVLTFLDMCERIDYLEREIVELRANKHDEIEEIGHDAIVVAGTVCTSENNPFLGKDWKP